MYRVDSVYESIIEFLCSLYSGAVQASALAKANSRATEALGAMRTVQASNAEVGEARRFAEQINAFLKVVIITVWTQTVLIFTQLGLPKVVSSKQ